MLKCTYRIYALSLAGGALLLCGATVAAGAMTLPKPSAVTEQATAAIVADGAGAAKVEQIWWRGHRYGWHRGYGWHRRWGWHRGWGWRGRRRCYWHPYAC